MIPRDPNNMGARRLVVFSEALPTLEMMMAEEHTPGPLSFKKSRVSTRWLIYGTDALIGFVERKQDAILFAKAPNLLWFVRRFAAIGQPDSVEAQELIDEIEDSNDS